MTDKRKPGRPDTHLSEKPKAIRMTQAMHDQIATAAARAGKSWSQWWRDAVQDALSAVRR